MRRWRPAVLVSLAGVSLMVFLTAASNREPILAKSQGNQSSVQGGVSQDPGHGKSGEAKGKKRGYVIGLTIASGKDKPKTALVPGLDQRTLRDKKPPAITIVEPTARDYSTEEDIPLNFYAEDPQSGVADIYAELDGVEVKNGQVIDLAGYSLGPHTLAVTAIDNAANSSKKSVTFQVVERDTIPPVITITSPEPIQYLTTYGRIAISYTVTDNQDPNPEVWKELDGVIYGPKAVNTRDLPLWAHSLKVYARDASGNLGTASITFFIVPEYDRNPPVVTILNPEAKEYSEQETITIQWEAGDQESGIWWQKGELDGAEVSNGQEIHASDLSLWSHILKVTAQDNAGNLTTERVTFDIIPIDTPVYHTIYIPKDGSRSLIGWIGYWEDTPECMSTVPGSIVMLL